jgi:two-component system, NtrC family, response regulator HydG
MYRVVIDSGPDAPAELDLGASYLRATVGQAAVCALRLTDPEVSRRHFALEPSEHGVALDDLSSTNGTWVNGVRVERAHLTGGEHIQIGRTVLRLECTDAMGVVTLSDRTSFGKVVGASPQMRELYALCERVSKTELPVLIEGETGTGKEALAESIHDESPRHGGPFVVFDCTAIAPALAESELFGHERGAFTGAVSTRRGVFEQADGGTLFIDELGELDPSLQPKLLRALERREVRRVGGDHWVKFDVRLLSATRRDVDAEIQAGRFRDDLFFRLAVARVELPPLRARTGDVAVLLRHFWSALGGPEPIPYDVERRFERHTWPGNVRELRNAVARQLALGSAHALGGAAAEEARTEGVEGILSRDLPFSRARELALRDFERRYLERLLALHGGNVGRAAAASGVARRYFNVLLARQRRSG